MSAKKFARLHLAYSLLIVATAFFLCGIVVFFIHWSLRNLEDDFKADAAYTSRHIRDQLSENETILIGLGAYINGEALIDIGAVDAYSSVMMQRFPHVSMFQIAQYIDAESVASFKQIMVKQGITNAGVYKFGSAQSDLISDDAMHGKLPVIFVAPTASKAVLGLDLLSIDFIRKSLPSGPYTEMTISEPIELFEGEKALVMMQSIPRNNNHKESYLALVLIKQDRIFPGYDKSKNWNLKVSVIQPSGKFFPVGTVIEQMPQEKTGSFLRRLSISDDVEFSKYKINITISKNITWLDLNLWNLSLLGLMVLVILVVLCVIYLMHFSVEVQREKHQKMLFKQANYDALTKLPNRFYFEDAARRILLNAQREKLGVLLLFVDLNGFKAINDNLGHDAGDKVLKEVARALKLVLRQSDLAARLGGDEFVILIDDIKDLTAVLHMIEKIRHALQGLRVEGVPTDKVSGSVGFSFTLQHGYDLITLLKVADNSMYGEKHFHYKCSEEN
jgi:diguanylate cyclase (GGDEF)-like protein